ncbi:MAG: hypothetical protein JW801_16370 [Bacteroidales bacterium]|nr:hypothetical protein [Bacteroidales bacterium]
MKHIFHTFKLLFLLAGSSFFLSDCASYKPTELEDLSAVHAPSFAQEKPVDILCSYYNLKHLDTLEGSRQTYFERDQKIARDEVADQLGKLCKQKSTCISQFALTIDSTAIDKDNYIDFRIHQFVAWSDILLMLLPWYYAINESYCVTADVYRNGELADSFEEWGFIRVSGFWIIEFADQPRGLDLRSYLVLKVLNKVAASYPAQ